MYRHFPQKLEKNQAISLVVLSAAIWGFGFVATFWALAWVGPLWMTALRFLLAFLLCLPFFVFFRPPVSLNRTALLATILPGFLIGATIGFQTWGLKYTSVTNAGFITTLYVMLVPIFERLFFQREVSNRAYLLAGFGLLGTFLMCRLHTFTFNAGDALVFCCAVAAAFHIIAVDRLLGRLPSSLQFNAYQSLWAGFFAMAAALALEVAPTTMPTDLATFGFMWILFGSTIFGFMVQVAAQRILKPELVAMLFLLESPFAAVFGAVFLNEGMDVWQMVGGSLILGSAAAAVRLHR